MPYTPQQNGVAEPKNQALKEMATCMMEEKDLDNKLWYEAINCIAYVYNIAPKKSLEGKTPFEAWSDHNPNVSHFGVFGSKAWARFLPGRERDCNLKERSPLWLYMMNMKMIQAILSLIS